MAIAIGLAGVPEARADPTNETYSDYEQETIDMALERHGVVIDPHPEGKRVVAIDVDVLDVIEDRDPVPNFLNVFHANTRDYILRREMLFQVGDRYDPRRANESERNMRGLRQESLVIVLPLRTDDPETVRVLIVAKDIWSLRLNSNYRLRGGQLEELLIQPAEENLAGIHRRLLANFLYEPDTITTGGRFIDPRLGGTRYAWQLSANVIVNHRTGDVEGSSGSFSYGLPIYSTKQTWAWSAAASWNKSITRRFVGTTLAYYDSPQTREVDGIPFVYDSESIGGSMRVTRSFGYDVKQDVSLGVEVDRSVYRAGDLGGFDPRAAADFEAERVPFSETRNNPFLLYHLYFNRFTSITNAETLGLQESFVLGPEAYARFYPIAKAFGSTRNVLGYHMAGAYTERLGTGLVRAYLGGTLETQILDEGGMSLSDSELQIGFRLITPPFYIGRLFYDSTFLYRPDNFSNRLVSLGGDGRLRGYPSGLFIGESLIASNLEFRSRPLRLWTVLLGGALFYDVGDAFDGTAIKIKQGAGFGLRLLFPQLDRSVMRIDWGFALTPDPGVTSVFDGLVLTFSQAFGMPRPSGVNVSLAP
ncbi:MAG: hypothetical protein KC731_21265 [Myxococcales bacterium]|nr:hypothetical protein [Myxococcales bacterium]